MYLWFYEKLSTYMYVHVCMQIWSTTWHKYMYMYKMY